MPSGLQNVEKRTSNGCWTCRLRKLKCDEARDTCHRCRRHGIPCAGYSSKKPEWKDGGVQEAERLMAIKALVSKKRKCNFQATQIMANPATMLPTFPSAGFEHLPHSKLLKPPLLGTAVNAKRNLPRPQSVLENRPHPFTALLLSSLPPEQFSSNNISAADREDELVSHYFDHIFNLQFQHYAARVSPKSWLLSPIQRIVPLRYSILSISALHQYRSNRAETSGLRDDAFHELQEHYGTALRRLREFIHDSSNKSPTDSHVPIICCCVQLISFDVSGELHSTSYGTIKC